MTLSAAAQLHPVWAGERRDPGAKAAKALFDQGSPTAIISMYAASEADRELGDQIPGWNQLDLRSVPHRGSPGAHFGRS